MRPATGDLKFLPTIDRYFGDIVRSELGSDVTVHPIAKQIKRQNTEYLLGIEIILKDLEEIPGSQEVIQDSRNPSEFYDDLSTLKFCRLLRENGYRIDQVLGDKSSSKRPDIEFYALGSVAYAEVKHIADSDELKNMVIEHFSNFKSMFDVSIRGIGQTFYRSSIQRLITEIEKKIRDKQAANDLSEERFEVRNLAECQLIPKRQDLAHPTGVIISTGFFGVTPDMFREKISELLGYAVLQLKPFHDEPNYVFLESELITLDMEDTSSLLYGSRTTSSSVEDLRSSPHWKRLEMALRNGFGNLLLNEGVFTRVTKNNLDGLYLDENLDSLNSLLLVDFRKRVREYQNPFVSSRKIREPLFRCDPCYPLSTRWLDKWVSTS